MDEEQLNEAPEGAEEAAEGTGEQGGRKRRFRRKKQKPEGPIYKELNYDNMTVRYDSALINKQEINKRNLILYPGVVIAAILSVCIPMWIVAPLMERRGHSQISITLWTVVIAVILASVFLYMVYRLLMMKLPRYFEFVEWIMRFGRHDIKVGYHKGEIVILVRVNGKWSRKHFEWFPEKTMNDADVDRNSDVFVSLDLTKSTPVFNVINV